MNRLGKAEMVEEHRPTETDGRRRSAGFKQTGKS